MLIATCKSIEVWGERFVVSTLRWQTSKHSKSWKQHVLAKCYALEAAKEFEKIFSSNFIYWAPRTMLNDALAICLWPLSFRPATL